jgi:hypothetical protein
MLGYVEQFSQLKWFGAILGSKLLRNAGIY